MTTQLLNFRAATYRTARQGIIFRTLSICAAKRPLFHVRPSHHTNLSKDQEILALNLASLVNMISFYFSCLKALGPSKTACRPMLPLSISY